jgi:PPM family protein phosphatase
VSIETNARALASDVPNAFDLAAVSDVGPERPNNEDRAGHWAESSMSAVLVVADGIGGYEGGEIASDLAVTVTLKAYRESPPGWGAGKRLYRAVQQANIEIYDKAVVVPELRRMGTTITAAALDGATLHAAHVGDTRLYLVRDGTITQITKDHTLPSERSTLTRRLGGELIAAIDRITLPLEQADTIVVCTDGLYNVVPDADIQSLVYGLEAEAAARRLVGEANARGTHDNVTAAVLRLVGPVPSHEPRTVKERLRRLLEW